MKIDLYNGLCEDYLKLIPDKSVDAIICDPPYNVLSNGQRKDTAIVLNHTWDFKLNWQPLCEEFKRIMKSPKSPIVLFYAYNQKYKLVSEIQEYGLKFKYDYIWSKPNANGNFMNAKILPKFNCESVLIFSIGAGCPLFYNNYDPEEVEVIFDQCYYCESAKVIGNLKNVTADYDIWLQKCLAGDEEALEHIRFTNVKVRENPDGVTTKLRYRSQWRICPKLEVCFR